MRFEGKQNLFTEFLVSFSPNFSRNFGGRFRDLFGTSPSNKWSVLNVFVREIVVHAFFRSVNKIGDKLSHRINVLLFSFSGPRMPNCTITSVLLLPWLGQNIGTSSVDSKYLLFLLPGNNYI